MQQSHQPPLDTPILRVLEALGMCLRRQDYLRTQVACWLFSHHQWSQHHPLWSVRRKKSLTPSPRIQKSLTPSPRIHKVTILTNLSYCCLVVLKLRAYRWKKNWKCIFWITEYDPIRLKVWLSLSKYCKRLLMSTKCIFWRNKPCHLKL